VVGSRPPLRSLRFSPNERPMHPNPSTASEAADAALSHDPPAVLMLLGRRNGGWRLLPHPELRWLDDLIGFTAPTSWAGVATVNECRVLAEGAPPTDGLIAAVTLRSGITATSILTCEGVMRYSSDEPVAGHVADAHRRALGLPSAPEASDPGELLRRLWLDDLVWLVTELGPEVPLVDWAAVRALDPARRWGGSIPSWEALHAELVATGQGWGAFSADQVAWMDAPMWARYVLDELPPVATSLAALEQVMPEQTFRKLQGCLSGTPSGLG
jgi:hypothetical protein